MTMRADVAIVGAGPYGLSLAAHLQSVGVGFRIFGRPMELWLSHMPEGMLLKSDGFASSLSDPLDEFPLSRFCKERSIDYGDEHTPVKLRTFCDYGLAFQNRFVAGLEEKLVESIDPDGDGFALRLDDGAMARARRVVIAVGVGHFRHLPKTLEQLPDPFVSHSFDHRDLSQFAKRRVAVVGSGASAIDLAGLLNEQGCDAQLICRRDALRFSGAPSSTSRSLWQRIRRPRSGLGPGLRSRFATDAPLLIHFLPQALRLEFVRRHLGPAAGWPMREKIEGRVSVSTGCEVASARVSDGRVCLELRMRDGRHSQTVVDHVVAATGFRTDLRRLEFLSPSLLAKIAHVDHAPILSSSFESSINGLYFAGPAAATSFGPLMRFAYGASFASRRLTRALSRAERPSGQSTEAATGLTPRSQTLQS